MDRNILFAPSLTAFAGSPPARVAWIETFTADFPAISSKVATREGGVDRNVFLLPYAAALLVATREGGVDRNRW